MSQFGSLEIKRSKPRENFTGIKNEESIYLKCSNCLAPLAEILIVDKDFDMKWKFKADCPHCGDHSFIEEVKGRFYIGPGLENNDKTDLEGDKDQIYTIVETFEQVDDVVVVKTIKGKQWNNG